MHSLKPICFSFFMLTALVSYGQIPIPKPTIHLLGHNELAWERYTKLWVKDNAALSQHNRHEQLPNQLLPAHIRSEIKSIRLVVDLVAVAGSANWQGFLINATDDTIRIERADATIANIRTEVYTNGQWLTLQKDMGARCGNSYWTMALAPNHYVAVQIDPLSGP